MYLHVKEEASFAGAIPVLWVLPEAEAKDKVIIYYHGWGSDIESSRFRASIWAAVDYPVLVVEEALHGARGSWDYEDIQKLPEVVIENMKEFDVILACVRGRFPEKKIVVAGHSMGGMTTMGLLARDEVAGGIALNGLGDWAPLAIGPYKEGAQAYDPMNHIEKHEDKGICMLNGELDDVVNPAYQKNYYEKIKKQHRGDAPLVFEIIEGTSHVVTTNMMAMTLYFLEQM